MRIARIVVSLLIVLVVVGTAATTEFVEYLGNMSKYMKQVKPITEYFAENPAFHHTEACIRLRSLANLAQSNFVQAAKLVDGEEEAQALLAMGYVTIAIGLAADGLEEFDVKLIEAGTAVMSKATEYMLGVMAKW